MRLYWNYILVNLKSQMQYRFSFLLTIIGQFITSFTWLFGLAFIFQYVDSIDDFTYEEVFLCFAVVTMAFSIAEMLGGGLATFSQLIGNGNLDRILLRPQNIILQVIVPEMDFTRIGLLLQAIVIFCYAIPNCEIIWDWKKIMTLCLMVICGSILFFALFLFKAAFTFFTIQGLDFLNIFTYGARKLGRYPFSIYGKTVLNILTFVVPLALFQYYPLLYLLGKLENDYYMLFPLLALLFLIPCYLLFRFGLRQYKSIGS